MSKASTAKVYRLPKHSLAKIACYKRYLEIYLAVIANTPIKKVYLLDLFAGEGKDIDNNSCSSVAAAEVLREHHLNLNKTCNDVVLFLNDSGDSVIEKNVKKIDRVKKFVDALSLTQKVNVQYSDKEFEVLIPAIIKRLQKLTKEEKALCFIDPFGYKYSKPETIKDLMSNGQTEILLFIPICFMHRFTGKALRDDAFVGGKHIDDFISELFQGQIPDLKNQIRFIECIQKQFKIYLDIKYVDVLFIEKEKGQFFGLFFFSNSKRGFQKMLEAKWTIDEADGHGFKVNHGSIAQSLFDNIDHENYTSILYDELKKRKQMSNQELFDFGLDNNHLPKHTKKVLDELKKENKIQAVDIKGNKALGYYLEDEHEKQITIKII